MAEKIIDIKINAKEATKAIETLDKSILQLEDNVSEATRELNKMEAELAKVTGASGKDLVKRQQLNKRIAKTKAFIKEENFALKENNKQKTKAKKKEIRDIDGLFLMVKPDGGELKVNPDSVEHALSIGWKHT